MSRTYTETIPSFILVSPVSGGKGERTDVRRVFAGRGAVGWCRGKYAPYIDAELGHVYDNDRLFHPAGADGDPI